MKTSSALLPYYDEKGFDNLICDEDNGLFAIFDGMGTSEDARTASSYAKKHLEDNVGNIMHYEILRHLINRIKKEVTDMNLSTGTTATVAYVDRIGNLHYVHCGDSRLYVLKGNRVKQITADEGVESILYNYVGTYGVGVCQLGVLAPSEWDKFMLCSDGVTGDRFPDIISDITIEDQLRYSKTPEIAVENIIEESTKEDDKSIIVVYK